MYLYYNSYSTTLHSLFIECNGSLLALLYALCALAVKNT